MISFRMNWLDLLAVQGTLKESSPTPQFKNSKTQKINSSVLSFLHSLTFTSIHYHWKNHSLDRWTFVGKVMSLLSNMLSRLIIDFLPRSKHLSISRLQSPSAVIFGTHPPKKKKFPTFSIVSPLICHEVMGPDAMILFSEFRVLSQLFHSPLSRTSRGSLVLL